LSGDAELTSYDSTDVDTYLEHVERPDSWNNLYERPYLISKLPLLKERNVLDIGCGSGYFTDYVLKRGAKVTAIDISRKMTELLTSRIKSANLTLHSADISKPMPFLASESYDVAIGSLVLHYIKDWNPLLKELHRVMKAGGRIFITTHHPFNMYLYLKPESYYDFKLVEDTWGKPESRFRVHYYIRPLSEMLQPLLHSELTINAIEEMQPDKSLKENHLALYKRLTERPGFLYIELAKDSG
jgi:SAM-dependent methyltransferase